MGTRGAIAFKVVGQIKASYNHWDSYPSGLGNKMLHFLRNEAGTSTLARAQADLLIAAPENRKPTPAEVERLKPFTDLRVSEGSTQDWYCLLRGTQFEPSKILEAGYFYPTTVGHDDYSYVVDYDDQKLEVWEGNSVIAAYAFDKLPEKFTDDPLPASTYAKAWSV